MAKPQSLVIESLAQYRLNDPHSVWGEENLELGMLTTCYWAKGRWRKRSVGTPWEESGPSKF